MKRQMKLRGTVKLEQNNTLTFSSQMYDKTPFSLPVDQFDIELNETFTPKRRFVEGWLFVEQEAQQTDHVYLTLPKPTLQFGKQITVHELQLMPRKATIADFGGKKQVATRKAVPKKSTS